MARKRSNKGMPWQRFDKCEAKEDIQDLLRNPSIIRPLYDGWGERDGEEFFASNEGWDDHK